MKALSIYTILYMRYQVADDNMIIIQDARSLFSEPEVTDPDSIEVMCYVYNNVLCFDSNAIPDQPVQSFLVMDNIQL